RFADLVPRGQSPGADSGRSGALQGRRSAVRFLRRVHDRRKCGDRHEGGRRSERTRDLPPQALRAPDGSRIFQSVILGPLLPPASAMIRDRREYQDVHGSARAILADPGSARIETMSEAARRPKYSYYEDLQVDADRHV